MTVERDLSRLRFLCVRVQKGEILNTDDIDYIMTQHDYFIGVVKCLEECIETLRKKEEMR